MSMSVHTTSDSEKNCKKSFSFVLFGGKPSYEEETRYQRIFGFLDSLDIQITNLETNKCYPSQIENEEVTELKVKVNPLLLRRLKNKAS